MESTQDEHVPLDLRIGDLVRITAEGFDQGDARYVVCFDRDPGLVTLREVTADTKKGRAFRIGRRHVQLTHRAVEVV